MDFNKFIFDNYLSTDEGEIALYFFNNFEKTIKNSNANELLEFINKQYLQKSSEEYIIDVLSLVNDSLKYQMEEYPKENGEVVSINSAEKYYDFFIQLTIKNFSSNTKRELLNYITDISMILHILHPEYFFPYFFVDHFYKVEAIFSEFGIPLPAIPSKVKHEERLYYYFELCKSIYEFRDKIGLTPIELNIFLYYFSENIIDSNDFLEESLPNPTKVYISGATKEDCTGVIQHANHKTKSLWAGNVNTLPGDIIIIYGVTPFSEVNSIWRAISKGFLDPFSYWFNLIWVGHPIKIPTISYQELTNNKIWGEKGIVKSHMQGVSGTQCTVEEYNELVNIIKSKGFKERLPVITGPQLSIKEELNNERDIEIYLLEPLLKKIGYNENDWIRQMSVRMGRGERIYPDYAVKANITRGEETAEFIWEAKYRITNQKQLKDTFFQAKSYALRLNSSGLGLVSMEGIWLSFKRDSFYFDKIVKYTWEEINNTDVFHKILLSIGNQK